MVVVFSPLTGDSQSYSRRSYNASMTLELMPADVADKPVLQSLMQLYLYDMSPATGDEVDDHGRYDYGYLDYYWTEPGRHAFLLRHDGRLAGFALVRTLENGPDPLRQLAEFFIMRRYQRRGLGRAAATAVFDRLPGRWEVDQVATNAAAIAFWRRVIDDYTQNSYREEWRTEGGYNGPTQIFRSRAI